MVYINAKNRSYFWKCFIIICGFFFLTIQFPILAQKVAAKVTIELKNLPEERQIEAAELDQALLHYINSHNWVEDDQGGEIAFNLQMVLSDMSVGGESRYRANLLVSNEQDVQFFDRRCRFAYQKNEPLLHNATQLNSLTTLIDYYVYFILGHEFDKFSEYGGSSYFRLAQQRAEQGRFGLGQFIEGWDQREEEVRKILSEENRPFRKMKDVFFYGIYLYDDKGEPEKGTQYVAHALKMIEEGLKKPDPDEKYKKFLGAYFNKLVQLFQNYKQKSEIFELLSRIDPDHAETYKQYIIE
ncbi:DUF4835 family protein [candidate division KSB1 bacterium]|nr:DUF4835 family protein [candidate division KSB1 bacterium]